jgi:hypothetical protein
LQAKASAHQRPFSASRRRACARTLSPSPPCSPPRDAPCASTSGHRDRTAQREAAVGQPVGSASHAHRPAVEASSQDDSFAPLVSSLGLPGEPACHEPVQTDCQVDVSHDSPDKTSPLLVIPDEAPTLSTHALADAVACVVQSLEGSPASPGAKRACARQRHRSRSSAITASASSQPDAEPVQSPPSAANPAHELSLNAQLELKVISTSGPEAHPSTIQVSSPTTVRGNKNNHRHTPGTIADHDHHHNHQHKSPEPSSRYSPAPYSHPISLLSPSPGLTPPSAGTRARGRRRAVTDGLPLTEEQHHHALSHHAAVVHNSVQQVDSPTLALSATTATTAATNSMGSPLLARSDPRKCAVSYSAAAAAFPPLTPVAPLSASPSASSTTSTASTAVSTTESHARGRTQSHGKARNQETGGSSSRRARASARARAELASLAPAGPFPHAPTTGHGRHDTLSASPSSMSLSLSPPMAPSTPSRPLNPQAVPYVPHPPLPPPSPMLLPAPPSFPSSHMILSGADLPKSVGPAGELLLPPLCLRDGVAYIPCIHPLTSEVLLVPASLFISGACALPHVS